jgi:hypothetical protein
MSGKLMDTNIDIGEPTPGVGMSGRCVIAEKTFYKGCALPDH